MIVNTKREDLHEGYTYSASGVDVTRNDEFTDYIKEIVTLPPWVMKEPTGYATIIELTTPPIVVTSDGIGSKLLLHLEHGTLNEAAKDLIAMNYNDIICVGGIPKAFVDYLGVHHIDRQHYEFIKALTEELEKINVSLVAGETAELPAIYTQDEWDVAGFCIGTLKQRIPIETIKEGDIIVGIPASGFHSNGWSLIRQILKKENIDLDSLPFDLLTGTKIYSDVSIVFNLVKGIAHVTGGGLSRALRRVLRDNGYNLTIELPEYMKWILSYITFDEALKTFNMGYGMILVTSIENVEEVVAKTNGKIIGNVSSTNNIVVQ
ncbi:MAG: phosphoribosylformylglycinamidine cyclo-ligase [Fervidobacterium sp.]|nr:phosphoribosylformylglycinamidine cyclo-ligase [Fervidobacterium sp.]